MNRTPAETALSKAMIRWSLSRASMVAETPSSILYRVEQNGRDPAALKQRPSEAHTLALIERLARRHDVELPIAEARDTLQQAPVIIVTRNEITYQGQLVATTESVSETPPPKATDAPKPAPVPTDRRSRGAHRPLPGPGRPMS